MHEKFQEVCDFVKDNKKAEEFFKEKLAFTIGPDCLNNMMKEYLDKFTLIDLRDYDDYIKGHIPYAVHVPFDQFEEQMLQFSKDKINIVYSYSYLCRKSTKAAYRLAKEGYPVKELIGGYKGWKKRDFDIVENDSD